MFITATIQWLLIQQKERNVKRVSLVVIAVMLLMFTAGQVLSGQSGQCDGSRKTATVTSAKISDTSACKAMSVEECARQCGMSIEECRAFKAEHPNCAMTTLSIEGMTGEGCEQQVSAALSQVDGVYRVVKVSYKDGTALLCTDPATCKGEMLTSVVSEKGYRATIQPTVSETKETPARSGKIGCDPLSCSKKCAVPCPGMGTKKKTGSK